MSVIIYESPAINRTVGVPYCKFKDCGKCLQLFLYVIQHIFKKNHKILRYFALFLCRKVTDS